MVHRPSLDDSSVALTFDDVLLQPRASSAQLPKRAQPLASRVGKAAEASALHCARDPTRATLGVSTAIRAVCACEKSELKLKSLMLVSIVPG